MRWCVWGTGRTHYVSQKGGRAFWTSSAGPRFGSAGLFQRNLALSGFQHHTGKTFRIYSGVTFRNFKISVFHSFASTLIAATASATSPTVSHFVLPRPPLSSKCLSISEYARASTRPAAPIETLRKSTSTAALSSTRCRFSFAR